MAKLGFPPQHLYQEVDSDNCGPCCLEMAYGFKNVDRKLRDILKDFHFGKKGKPTYPAQLARDAMKQGLKTRLIISNPRIIPPVWSNLPREKLVENVKDWLTLNPKHDWLAYGLHLLFYLLEGGDILLQSISVADLGKMISSGSILILGVDEVWLWGQRLDGRKHRFDNFNGNTSGHFVLTREFDNDSFTVLDPYPTKLPGRMGRYVVSGNELLNSILIWSGTGLEILK